MAKLRGTGLFKGGMGLQVRGRRPDVEELSLPAPMQTVAHNLYGSAVADDAPIEGQILRYRVTTESYRAEDLLIATVDDNVSSPPTDAELDAAFGQPGTLGDGFIGVLDDNGAGTTVWLCIAMNSAWWYEQLTKAV